MAGLFASALLDELMGRNRNKDPNGQRKTHWSDPEVITTAKFGRSECG